MLRPKKLNHNFRYFSKIAALSSFSITVSSILNFFYNVAVGKYLGPEQFGLLASLISIGSIIAIGASGFQITTAKAIATQNKIVLGKFFDSWTKKVMLLGLIISSFILIICFFIKNLFNAEFFIISPIAVYGFSTLVFAVGVGRLQGSQRIFEWQFWETFTVILKFVFAFLIILSGLTLNYFIISATLIGIITSMFIFYRTKNLGALNLKIFSNQVIINSLTMMLLWILFQFDIIFVRIYFSEKESGLFAAASVISKSIPLGVSLIGSMVMPEIANRVAEKKPTASYFSKLTIASFIMSSTVSFFVIYFNDLIIKNLFGIQFRGSENFLWKLAVTAIFWSIALSLIQAQLAKPSLIAFKILLITFIFEISLFITFGKTIDIVIIISGFVAIILTTAIIVMSNSKIGVK